MSEYQFLSLNPHSAQPLYLQIRDAVIDYIDFNNLQADAPLPSERELSETFSVNRMTVRKALNELEQSGSIYRKSGKGTFVAPPKLNQKLLVMTSFTDAVRNEGHTPGTKLLDYSMIMPRPSVRRALRVEDDCRVLKIKRLRSIDDEPFSVASSYIPEAVADHLRPDDFPGQSLYGLLKERCGIVMAKTVSSLETVSADDELAGYLEIAPGAPLFLMSGTTADEKGCIVEYFKVYYRGDRLKFSTESA